MTLEEYSRMQNNEREMFRCTSFYGFDCVLCGNPQSVHSMRDADPPICSQCRDVLQKIIAREKDAERALC